MNYYPIIKHIKREAAALFEKYPLKRKKGF